jgi:hypothetical protein
LKTNVIFPAASATAVLLAVAASEAFDVVLPLLFPLTVYEFLPA